VRTYQIDTLRHLLSFDIDGFRFDVVPLIPIEFWREARRKLDPDGKQIWLAETGFMRFVKKDKDLGIPHHADPELHEVFDISYDADGQEYLHAYFAGQAELSDYLHQAYLDPLAGRGRGAGQCGATRPPPVARYLERLQRERVGISRLGVFP
jgi:cyclomaltodextrinase / maltogenic alpha-amylase / neopullulanase